MAPHAVDGFESDTAVPRPAAVNGTNGTNGVANGVNGTNGHHAVNGHASSNGHSSPSSRTSLLRPTPADELHDLICVGFGPASLSIAVALNDYLEAGTLSQAPKVLFLEKQPQFAWHAGMLLPGAKMQISFIKDMASLRNPRSNFTFLNYLHANGRLVEFTNMDTFLPARSEYENYLRWCASHFGDVVRYSSEVASVQPLTNDGAVGSFEVTARNAKTGEPTTYRAKKVVLALGGQASIPRSLPAPNPKVIHSSQFAQLCPKILTNANAPYRVAVIGAGQSAAEIFSNIQTLYPNSRTWMVMRQEFIKPSDDSPFVNSVFNPEFVDSLYPRSLKDRRHLIKELRATNYGVVRLGLIEKLYELMYDQLRELGRDEKQWPHRIMGSRRIVGCEPQGDKLNLRVQRAPPCEDDDFVVEGCDIYGEVEELDADLIVAATGYKRDAHVDMLKSLWSYLPELKASSSPLEPIKGKPIIDQWEIKAPATKGTTEAPARSLGVGRDYKVQFAPGSVASEAGVWLQGCCEGTHGLSDTLLSILSVRSGEIVNSMFGTAAAPLK